MQMIIAAGCAASCLWNYVICSWNFRDETEMKLEFSRKFSLASNVRSLPLPIIFCYFVVSSWASPFVIIRNIDISFQLCVFEFIKLKIHPIIQIDIEPRCELEWSRGEVITGGGHQRRHHGDLHQGAVAHHHHLRRRQLLQRHVCLHAGMTICSLNVDRICEANCWIGCHLSW